MLKSIVPALGVIALASPAALSQEIAKGVFLNGWSDNVLAYTNEGYNPGGVDNSIGFSSSAKLIVGWNPAENISGKIAVRFHNTREAAETNTASAYFVDWEPVYLQESFVSANWGNGLNSTMGKMINHIGWQAMDPTGLYRVNKAPTAYYYGNDVIGLATGWSSEQAAAAILVTNGFFTTSDQYNGGAADPYLTDNLGHTLGLGLDFTYNLPNGNVNLEFAWDPTQAAAAADVYQVGLNATVKPGEKTLVGAEVIYRATNNRGATDNQEDLAWMLLANQVVSTEGVPASVTLSLAQDVPDFMMDDKNLSDGRTLNEVAVALLTNPMGSSSFGLNLEVMHRFHDGQQNKLGSTTYGASEGDTVVSLEGLISIP